MGTQEGPAYVWHIDKVRDHLAKMGLDWKQAAYPALKEDDSTPATASVDLPAHLSSSDYSKRYMAKAAFDGRSETRWNSARRVFGLPWIARVWPEPQTIREIIIHQAFDRIKFTIQRLSPIHCRWIDVHVGDTGGHGEDAAAINDKTRNPVFHVTLPESITTRGIRILVTGRVPEAHTVSIREIEFRE